MPQLTPLQRDQAHILIVEDSLTQAERLRYSLERQCYQVSAVLNGRQALQQIRVRRPTLVITDIMMPEMDGYELCRQIKSDPELHDIPVILLTTLSDPQDVIRGLECRADNFVVKPYDDGYLLSRIESMLVNAANRRPDQSGAGVEITFNDQRHLITANRQEILNLLLSTYDIAIQRNKELTRTKDALRDANVALEAVNKELETFSYSVSHDLRTPLRAIEGFSQSLLEVGTAFDGRSLDLLSRIKAASLRMKQLIEDLLQLSRINRGELQREKVNMTALAETVADELRLRDPERAVRVDVAPGIAAMGDARLLRVALENLFGNAWKFTSKSMGAAIEFGTFQENGAAVFFIRDNGAGFDMHYVERLFGAFQRLHTTEEFPGTGVGLATVQRVINRHGGRIWAKGVPDGGATFYFVLGKATHE